MHRAVLAALVVACVAGSAQAALPALNLTAAKAAAAASANITFTAKKAVLAALLAAGKNKKANATLPARFVGQVTCFIDDATGAVAGLQLGAAAPLCSSTGTARSFTVPADGYIASVAASQTATGLVGTLKFVVESGAGTNVVTCGTAGKVFGRRRLAQAALPLGGGAVSSVSCGCTTTPAGAPVLDPGSLRVAVTAPWASPLPSPPALTRVWYIAQYNDNQQTGMFRCVPQSDTVFNCSPVTWSGAGQPPADGNLGLVLVGDTAYVGSDNVGTNNLYSCPVAGGACGPPTTWSNWPQSGGGGVYQGGMMLAPGSTSSVIIVPGLATIGPSQLATCPIAPGATAACTFLTLSGLPSNNWVQTVADAGGGYVYVGQSFVAAPPAQYPVYRCSLATGACAPAATWTNFPVYNANGALNDQLYAAFADPAIGPYIFADVLNGPNLHRCPASGTGACDTITLVNGPTYSPNSFFGPAGIFSRLE